jgi:hypothetical protein
MFIAGYLVDVRKRKKVVRDGREEERSDIAEGDDDLDDDGFVIVGWRLEREQEKGKRRGEKRRGKKEKHRQTLHLSTSHYTHCSHSYSSIHTLIFVHSASYSPSSTLRPPCTPRPPSFLLTSSSIPTSKSLEPPNLCPLLQQRNRSPTDEEGVRRNQLLMPSSKVSTAHSSIAPPRVEAGAPKGASR